MWCHLHYHHMKAMASSMVLDTDASNGTNTVTISHIIPLNNHLNMTNAMVSWMAPSASCDRKHVTAMYIPKYNIPLKCHIYQLLHVHI